MIRENDFLFYLNKGGIVLKIMIIIVVLGGLSVGNVSAEAWKSEVKGKAVYYTLKNGSTSCEVRMLPNDVIMTFAETTDPSLTADSYDKKGNLRIGPPGGLFASKCMSKTGIPEHMYKRIERIYSK